jgi:CheY-like chemotaxis protein
LRDDEPFINRRYRPKTEVIMMTAHGSKEICKEAFARGTNCYYDKPIDIPDLAKRIQERGTMRKG